MLEKVIATIALITFLILSTTVSFVIGVGFRNDQIVELCNTQGKFYYTEDTYLCKKASNEK